MQRFETRGGVRVRKCVRVSRRFNVKSERFGARRSCQSSAGLATHVAPPALAGAAMIRGAAGRIFTARRGPRIDSRAALAERPGERRPPPCQTRRFIASKRSMVKSTGAPLSQS